MVEVLKYSNFQSLLTDHSLQMFLNGIKTALISKYRLRNTGYAGAYGFS